MIDKRYHCSRWPPSDNSYLVGLIGKHSQRHNGPKGWVQYQSSNKLKHKSWSSFIFRIWTNHQLQNLNQTSGSRLKLKSWPNLASEFWPRFNCVTSTDVSSKTLTKLQLQNLGWTSTSNSWPKCSKAEQRLSFMTKPQLSNLQQTVANTILVINISNSNNLNKFWVGIFTRQGHINKVY